MKQSFFLFFSILIISFVYSAEIILKDKEIVLSKDKIYLGDIADFVGFNEKTIEELSNIYLKKASLPGYKTVIPKELVSNKVFKYYGKVKINGPEKVIINIKKNEINRTDLIKTAETYIKEKMLWQEDEVNIEVKNINDKNSVDVPDGVVLLKVKEDFTTNFKGNVVIPVEIYIDNKFYKIETVSFFIKVTKVCFKSTRNIRSKEKLSDSDIESVKKDITYLPDDIILLREELDNLITRKAILKGTLLLRSMFESIPLFRKGARVYLIVKIKNIQVETEGIALGDGRINDLVRVRLDNKKILEGKVNKEGKVFIKK